MANDEKFEYFAEDFNVSLFPLFMMNDAFYYDFQDLLDMKVSFANVFENHNIQYFVRPSDWKGAHELLVKKIENGEIDLQKHLKKLTDYGEKVYNFASLIPSDISKLSNQQLLDIYNAFTQVNTKVYAYGLFLPLLDFQTSTYFSDRLQKILQDKLDLEKIQPIISLLTTPHEKTFGKKQELDLLMVLSQIEKESDLIQTIINQDIDSLIPNLSDNYPQIWQALVEHTQKYCWVYYGLDGPASDEQYFLEIIKDWLSKNLKSKDELTKHTSDLDKLVKEQKKSIKKLRLDQKEVEFIELARQAVLMKPWRKDVQSRGYYAMEKVLLEIGKRLDLNLRQIKMLLPRDIKAGLENNKIDALELQNRLDICIHLIENNKTDLLTAENARDFIAKNFKENDEIEQVDELKGTVACAGYAKGKATIVNSPDDMKNMQEGNILISFATNPNLMPAIRKAAAIITDEGGLTCHAAIVSRELKIPCVVGTKIATKIFKNGDNIEVDAQKGIVKIIPSEVDYER